jgi:hypothetical protein
VSNGTQGDPAAGFFCEEFVVILFGSFDPHETDTNLSETCSNPPPQILQLFSFDGFPKSDNVSPYEKQIACVCPYLLILFDNLRESH